ncbi:hypothetical protein [Devosia sp.]|uniref:hypothetical protein n=1 Tax=Devosia sp. TaxID=1871048 RepID=UPI003F6F68D0
MTPSARVIRELLGASELHHKASPRLRDAFIDLRHKLARAEAATVKRDGIEAEVLSRIDYPRVPLPVAPGQPPCVALTLSDIDHYVAGTGGGEALRRSLRLDLRTRQRQWREAAANTGLTAALRSEIASVQSLALATTLFFDAPILSQTDIALALALIIACGEPGPLQAAIFPWRELRQLFTAALKL